MSSKLPQANPLARWRAEKDRYMRENRNSPLYGSARFDGLAYYPEQPTLRVATEVERPAEPSSVRLATSSGEEREFVVYGTAHFELEGRPASLTLFAPVDAPDGPRLFVPFRDATSGPETYGAGRYMDPVLGEAGSLTLDFNYAYHPYCAYAEGYSCPFPPPQNRLDAPVRAGERLAEAEGEDGSRTAAADEDPRA